MRGVVGRQSRLSQRPELQSECPLAWGSVFAYQLLRLQRYQFREIFLLQPVYFLVEGVDLTGPVPRADLRSTNGAELGFLVVVVRQCLDMHGAGGVRIEGELKLLLPIEGVARE